MGWGWEVERVKNEYRELREEGEEQQQYHHRTTMILMMMIDKTGMHVAKPACLREREREREREKERERERERERFNQNCKYCYAVTLNRLKT